jgi:hypothetical protein
MIEMSPPSFSSARRATPSPLSKIPPSRHQRAAAAGLVLLCHSSVGGGEGGSGNHRRHPSAPLLAVMAFSPVAPPRGLVGICGRRTATTTTTKLPTFRGHRDRVVDRRFGVEPPLQFRRGGTPSSPSWWSPSSLYGSDDGNGDGDRGGGPTPPLLRRFLDPVVDDPGLPLTDALVAQVVAPTLQICWLTINAAPSPTWLAPIGRYFGEAPELAPRGSLLAPALIHGAGLAVCWGLGALAARLYEREAFSLSPSEGGTRSSSSLGGFAPILAGLVRAGAFAVGVLVLSTQIDLLLEFGGRYVTLGESDETDFRLLVAYVEIINDVFWEALVISTWRIAHANFMSDDGNRRRRF